ncbi:MAG: META domain-containing protein [Hyphomicrobiaceae bacterium]|nr:META domain-containing protein [Hyphomicrobiaceae bacterium]
MTLAKMPPPWQCRFMGWAIRVAAAATAATAVHAFTPAITDVPWRVVEIEGKAIEDAGVLVFYKNQVGGQAACNRLMGRWTPTEKGHAFAHIATTRMMCDEAKMAREQLLLKAMERMQSYKHEGLVLSLLDADGKPLVKLQQ